MPENGLRSYKYIKNKKINYQALVKYSKPRLCFFQKERIILLFYKKNNKNIFKK
ncbi:hypothetical protein JCM19301_3119 [Jejuia pallidilutea]|uniref:Uncharacterized protein n=1 Tax=Jejuia pallidilutea TaxID=504487 RepID=A0A090VYR5_9FLAO|nr:hypothetical protein JCM19301_3119 [Jejuia pallidilutea]GAL69900.1 hypothetical protein JCM19302_795 [Jejuia pallidilutea]GAL90922.1 hypothetical protein JCM19538_980 [Jejuia pallidilutea]